VDHTIQLADDDTPLPDRTYIDELLNSVYKGDKVDLKAVYKYVYDQLSQNIYKGFGSDFTRLGYNTPDWEKLSNLQYNAGVFAAFKNHSQLREMTRLLIADDGTRRSWKDFKEKALMLDNTYNVRWLRAEYNHAHSVARSAREWVEAEKTAHLYPNLQYVAVNDSRTRTQHRRWHGIILPVNHSFWDTHFPPNDWGCRCKTRRTDKPVDTKGVNVNDPVKNKDGFNINFGKQGKVFADDHPYYQINGYEKVFKEANKQLNNYLKKEILKKYTDVILHRKEIGNVLINKKGIEKIINKNYNNSRVLHYVLNFEQILKEMALDGIKYPPNTIKKRMSKKNILHYLKGTFKGYDKNYIVWLERDNALEKAEYKLYLIKEENR